MTSEKFIEYLKTYGHENDVVIPLIVEPKTRRVFPVEKFTPITGAGTPLILMTIDTDDTDMLDDLFISDEQGEGET